MLRIKMLADVGEFKKDSFVTVEQDVVAKGYIAAGLAEEAPESAQDELTETIKGLIAGVVKQITEKNEAEWKANKEKSQGPRIETGESELDRKKCLGHQLQLIGFACNEETTPVERQRVNETLKNLYDSAYRLWTKEDHEASRVTKSGIQTQTKAGSNLVESSGPLGGYGIYPEYSRDLYKVAIENTIFASRARKQPMASNSFVYPKLNQTHTQTGTTTGYLAGIFLWWQGEAAAINQTNPQLLQGVLKAGKLQGYTQFSMETIADDMIGLEAQVSDLVREGVGYYVDFATINGDGMDKPTGYINAPATIQVTRKGGAGSQTIDFADLTKLKRSILPQYRKDAFFIVALSAEDALWNISDANGRPLFLPTANPTAGAVQMNSGAGANQILGMQYEITEKVPGFGQTGDFSCVAPKGYILGERLGLEMAASNAPGFLTGLMTYRFVARVAGQPILDTYFTLNDGLSTQASTFSVLV